jgi:hypothetical protein
MLKVAPFEVKKVLTQGDESHELTFGVKPRGRKLMEMLEALKDDETIDWNTALVLEHLAYWRGVADSNGAPMPLNESNYEVVTSAFPQVRRAAIEAIWAAQPVIDQGNSKPSLGTSTTSEGEKPATDAGA